MNALIANARFHFHERLFETNTLTLTKTGVASNADTSSRGSKAIAGRIVDILVEEHHHTVNAVDKISGQTLGKQFELLTMEFLQETFPHLQTHPICFAGTPATSACSGTSFVTTAPAATIA